ncbi:nitric-oxide reductase large subunit [Tautonia sp. JC769]|uniref:nitric-oxide reductase large subunit n=1 Tax=Tautonia sp. JC769 TaxID=3232135 RepID=UPI003457F915
MKYLRLWIALGVVIAASFAVLGYYGWDLYRQAPPVPGRVVTTDGTVLFTGQTIKDGQNVWQSMGGQEVGTVWGHGSYVAPDWSADWLHREATWLVEHWAEADHGRPFDELDDEARAALQARLRRELRTNTYDPETGDLTVSPLRAEAIAAVGTHYAALFGDDPGLHELRDAYAIPANSLKTPERREQLNAFFFWASWACATNRPGGEVTYTNNWPAEELIANRPTGALVVWSVLSFVLLLAGIGALAWYFAAERHKGEVHHEPPGADPLLALRPTPSMRATLKFFWVVAALLVAQVGLGAVTAHYGVEGSGFYGFPLADWLPYSVTRTWHQQLGIFWIATAWLATGLFMAPAVSGHEPRFQRAGVNFLFACLLIIVVGSMAGQWLAVQQRLGLEANFWFGHQGYEYVDLGRFWQLFLTVGLFLWLFLMARAIWPAFRQPGDHKHLLGLFLLASAAIPIFYVPGLMWHRQTNLAVAEYWRWWVVHLWVEGFFEVFATVVIAFLFTRMGLLRTTTATAAVLFATTIFLSGGIIGTFHHLYFTGTPTAVLALGSVFSALEVVPLVLIGFEAYENLTLSQARPWVSAYRWPIYFFVAVAFWNLVGAGLFGFLINPPIALYYMQGLNTTPVHGHTALFGVYGMLGIGLMLFCMKGLTLRREWKTGALSLAFWTINVGLALMVLLSVLPVGLLQTWASVDRGMWYARSAEFMQTELMNTLRWLRVVGDTIFAAGVVALGWFVLGLRFGWSTRPEPDAVARAYPEQAAAEALSAR